MGGIVEKDLYEFIRDEIRDAVIRARESRTPLERTVVLREASQALERLNAAEEALLRLRRDYSSGRVRDA